MFDAHTTSFPRKRESRFFLSRLRYPAPTQLDRDEPSYSPTHASPRLDAAGEAGAPLLVAPGSTGAFAKAAIRAAVERLGTFASTKQATCRPVG
ncbi:MAG TPA: hypothetical protein VFR28_06955, partial [Allosphingosinicella sp.]|nr:hypothetical protein [Allosphingosinicella sp.]